MNESRATRYQRLRRRALTAGSVSAWLMLALIAVTPIAHSLSLFAQGVADGLTGTAAMTVSLVVFVVLLLVLWEVASLPAMIHLALRVDQRYGPRTASSVEDVLGAQAQATAIAVPAALLAGATVVMAVEVAGAWWWAAAGLILALVLIAALRGAPRLLTVLAEVRPVVRAGLAARLEALAHRARVPVAGIAEWVVEDSSHATALVTGVGRTRRVLLSSDVVSRWSDDEIAVVVAHELAHHVHRDLWRTLALDLGVLWAALYAADLAVQSAAPTLSLTGPGDLAALPLMALVASAVWGLATPLRHAQSRRHERRADVFALAMTDGAEAFGAAIRRLGAKLMAEERPSSWTRWLYYSHPSVAERLALADAYRRVRPER